MDKLQNAVEVSRKSYLAMNEEERKDRDCIRLRNTYAMVKELFPELDSKRALIVTGAVLEALFN